MQQVTKLLGISLQEIPYSVWNQAARNHLNRINDLLYPKIESKSLKFRSHAVSNHPIYNFLHSYYSYSTEEIKTYSPGMGYALSNTADFADSNRHHLIHKAMIKIPDCNSYIAKPSFAIKPVKRYGEEAVTRIRDILEATVNKPPHFSCFGLHEWAMLYRGKRLDENDPSTRHQPQLRLRVSQQVIDDTVGKNQIVCTHFDAWRFFDPAAQPLNVFHPMSRKEQVNYEQPGCIHATMDLFEYAYQLYPFVSSDMLAECLSIALIARKIDMRASPYDVSSFDGCEEPLYVETNEGKLAYIKEQQQLYKLSFPARQELLSIYNNYLHLSNFNSNL
jgi:hypothetical protein